MLEKRVPVKCETKQEGNETDRNERNKSKRNGTDRNETKQIETKQMIWQAIVDNYRYFLI